MASIFILHGPNLNLLSSREPTLYGTESLADLNQSLDNLAKQHGHHVVCKQSNSEAELIDAIQQAPINKTDFIIFNPAGYTHTSIALRDALLAVSIPFIEVHVSNIYARESFRQHSYFSDIAQGIISGMGTYGYQLALLGAIEKLR